MIQPVSEILETVRAGGGLFHVDGTQAAGKLPIDLAELPAFFGAAERDGLAGGAGAGKVYLDAQGEITGMQDKMTQLEARQSL